MGEGKGQQILRSSHRLRRGVSTGFAARKTHIDTRTFDKSKWTRYSGLNYRQLSFRYCIDKTVDLHIVSHILSEHKM